MLKRALILHHPQNEGAAAFAAQLSRELRSRSVETYVADAWEASVPAHVAGAEIIFCVGGDGTVLRAARCAVPHAVPILGVNMGRLGFLTDLSPRDCFTNLERILEKDWRLEERVMVRADLPDGPPGQREFHGLNDIVVSRQSPGRPVYVDLRIDHTRVAVYRCDGIIVSTPTGSTGYSLSAGGPILAPTEHQLVVTPVSAHLALARSIVLQPQSEVELRVTSDHGAVLSVDGQDDLSVASGTTVAVRLSEHRTQFVRFRDPSSFYGELAEKLEFQLSSTMSSSA